MMGVLKEMGLDFTPEYSIVGSKSRFDFYIPELGLLVEMDGQQHFVGITFGCTTKTPEQCFAKQYGRDLYKDQLALKNSFHLLRIPYTHKTAEQMRIAMQAMVDDVHNGKKASIVYVNEGLYSARMHSTQK